jgi:hypothetical protein
MRRSSPPLSRSDNTTSLIPSRRGEHGGQHAGRHNPADRSGSPTGHTAEPPAGVHPLQGTGPRIAARPRRNTPDAGNQRGARHGRPLARNGGQAPPIRVAASYQITQRVRLIPHWAGASPGWCRPCNGGRASWRTTPAETSRAPLPGPSRLAAGHRASAWTRGQPNPGNRDCLLGSAGAATPRTRTASGPALAEDIRVQDADRRVRLDDLPQALFADHLTGRRDA